MDAKLLCRTGELSGKTYSLTAETVIGRGDGSTVVISSHLVSGRHVSIRQDGRGFILEDLGSTNGTWVDGERVLHPVRLNRLNVISLAGAFDLIFHDNTDASPSAPPSVERPEQTSTAAKSAATMRKEPRRPEEAIPTSSGPQETQLLQRTFGVVPTLERAEPSPAPTGGSTMHLEGPFALPTLEPQAPDAAHPRFCLEISRVGGSTRTIELMPSRRYTLGRADDCDIRLEDPQLSRHHATVTVGDSVVVEDAGSRIGTHMAGRRISAPAVLVPGEAFMLGSGISVRLIAR